MIRGPRLYRGVDGVMRTFADTAKHLGITQEELRIRWYGAKEPIHIRNDGAYYRTVRRNAFGQVKRKPYRS